ncbi:serine protease 3-like [Neocloeon triangulifer]|uniref:serine protease 3-like n=1 Tax=Neocloeon triangulifer TaxID=2078957 RepID=UPI00286F6814|nr:serine protease 3-like [Neocloeon triangulifer]
MNAVPVVLLVLLAGISLSQQASFNTPRALKMIMRDRNANKTKITKTELSIFEKDPRSKPRLDFTPRGKKPQNGGLANTDLNYVTLNTVTNVKCASVYGFYYIRSSVICTSTSSSKTICGGDSGGSLTYKGTDGKETIIGVVSFGSAKSCQNSPTGYSRVSSFLGWISGKTGIKVDP